ncbi:MAG: hypothetical protein HYY24_25440 [Verrucomicrobia bacterium]|nr:hypothetical protein [Verrucomicrobiota bacterium]
MTECKFNCPQCSRRLKIAAEFCGRQIRCPACQAVIEVPASDGAVHGGEGETLAASRLLDAQQARTTVYWRRKEPPTSSHGHKGTAGSPETP